MNVKSVRNRVIAFVVIAAFVVGYLGLRYVGLDRLFRPTFTVQAHFSDSGGIFVGAEVDVRGNKVGTVSDMTVVPDGVSVALELNNGTKISARTHATVTDRSALGEQYVELTPPTNAGPYLHGGSVIPVSATSIPVSTQQLLTSLDNLAKSVPTGALTTVLTELGKTFSGVGPQLGALLDSTSSLTKAALADLDNTIALINDSKTVLDTQVASGTQLNTISAHLVSLADTLRTLDPTIAEVLNRGISATAQVTDLLDDTQQALPVLLNNLVTINDVLANRVPELRKLLVTFPHALENGLTLVRYCDKYDPKTNKPIQSSCHYDPRTGLPDYTAHFGLQLSPYPLVCTQGYQGTTKYLPNGQPLSGSGPAETSTTKPNTAAGCTASPTSSTPNVRGAQNAAQSGTANTASTAAALYDPLNGGVLTADGTAFVVNGSSAPAPNDLGALMTMGNS